MDEMPMTLGGEEVVALPERALYWSRQHTIFVADVHFGKDATFRQAHRWIPPGTTTDDLRRLAGLLTTHQAKRLVILGDAFHSEHAGEEQTVAELQQWRESTGVEIVMVRGNHDRRAEDLARSLNFVVVDEGHSLGPWILHHHPPQSARSSYGLCGHVHPVALVRGRARQWLRVPCFWANAWRCMLPAFGGFTGGSVVKPKAGDLVALVAEGQVLRAGWDQGRRSKGD